jgi:hypothetical protein
VHRPQSCQRELRGKRIYIPPYLANAGSTGGPMWPMSVLELRKNDRQCVRGKRTVRHDECGVNDLWLCRAGRDVKAA